MANNATLLISAAFSSVTLELNQRIYFLPPSAKWLRALSKKVFSTSKLVIVQEIGISIIFASISATLFIPVRHFIDTFCINKIIKYCLPRNAFFGWNSPQRLCTLIRNIGKASSWLNRIHLSFGIRRQSSRRVTQLQVFVNFNWFTCRISKRA